MKTKSRNFLITSLTMIVMMVAILFSVVAISPLTAYAASGTGTESDPYVVTTYAELRDLMANAPTDGTTCYIALGSDITSNDSNNDYALTLVDEDQKVVLDLAGHTITRTPSITVDLSVVRAKEGTLTIDDSVGTGGIYSDAHVLYTPIGLIADNVYGDKGTIIINAGTYTSNKTSGLSYGLLNQCGSVIINGGNFTGQYGLKIDSGRLSVYGGNFRGTEYEGIRIASDATTKLYNLTANSSIECPNGNVWDYIPSKTVLVNGQKQQVTSTNQISGTNIVVSTDFVEELNISIAAPVVGNVMETEAYVPNNAEYEIVKDNGNQVLNWYQGDTQVSGTFAATTVYEIRLYVKVTGIAHPDLVAKVNNNDANLTFQMESMEGDRYYWVSYIFPATIDNIIPSTSVTITEPVAGQNSKAGSIYNTEKYNVSVGWSDTEDGDSLNNFNGKTFVAGNTYYADLTLTAQDPYEFVANAKIYVNGVEYTAVWTVGSSYPKYVSVYDIPFVCPSNATYTVSFNGNGGTGSMSDDTDQLGGYILPDNGFTAPANKQFVCWAVGSSNGDLYAVGEEYNVQGNVTFYAIWEDVPVTEYMVSYSGNGGEGTMTGDMVEAGGTFTLDACTYEAPNGKRFAGWAVGSIDATPLKQAGDQITINADTIIYAIWEDIPHSHDLEEIAAKEPTCQVVGNIAYWHCKSCGKYFSDKDGENEIELKDTVRDKVAHTPVVDTGKAATCTETGLTDGSHCSVCGTVLAEQEVVPALGHAWGEWQVITPATETQEGLERRTCSRCDHFEERSIPVLGHVHTIVAVEAKAATCDVAGNSAHYECSACHKYFSDAEGTHEINTEDFTIAALGHDWGEWIVTTPAQIGVKGIETRTCNRDHNHTETRETPALPYEYKTIDGVKVYSETLTAGQAKDLSGLFEEAKAQNGKVALTVGNLSLVFDANAVNTLGGETISLTANVVTENLTIDGAQLVIDITLTGASASFGNGKVTVSVPFTTAVPSGKVAKVYYVNGNDKTDMNAAFADGKVSFDTNHFSTFAVVFEDEQTAPVNPTPSDPEVNPTPEKKGLSGGAIAGIVIAIVVVLAGAGVGVFFLLKKKGVLGGKKTDEPKKEDEPKD